MFWIGIWKRGVPLDETATGPLDETATGPLDETATVD